MSIFASVQAIRGTISFRTPTAPTPALEPTPTSLAPVPEPIEYDEDGRRYAFRFPRRQPQPVVIDRDRLFDYVRRRRPAADGQGSLPLLPDMDVRRYVRDLRNRADFYTSVRELQTHPDVEAYLKVASQRRCASSVETSAMGLATNHE
jgi:hypothetical protein